MAQPLLIEFFCEELPPKSLKKMAQSFSQNLLAALTKHHAISASSVKIIATPRRFGAYIDHVDARSPAQDVQIKLLPENIAYPNGKNSDPGIALQKKMQQLGITPEVLSIEDGYLWARYSKPGLTLEEILAPFLAQVIPTLPIAKMMRYQKNGETLHFVRPMHSWVAMHGTRVLPLQFLHQAAGRSTYGHRFMDDGAPFDIHDAADYFQQMVNHYVMVDIQARQDNILAQLQASALMLTHANEAPIELIYTDDLLTEVTALVEWPKVYCGTFDEAFLNVPHECLILSMQTHQKYFALKQNGQLLPKFLLVSNMDIADPGAIIQGNERVIRPRLTDAQFFYQQDCKTPLLAHAEKLHKVIYQQKLGSQAERCARIAAIAHDLVATLGVEHQRADIDITAQLLKADLSTDMVGEFPELQGFMGQHYAQKEGYAEHIAQAIAQHYQPRFADDAIGTSAFSHLFAISDKLENLVGIWSVGLAPTAEKDPYALRRSALGLVRILLECGYGLHLSEIIAHITRTYFAAHVPDIALQTQAIKHFVTERLKFYLKDKMGARDEMDAIFAMPHALDSLSEVLPKIQALQQLRASVPGMTTDSTPWPLALWAANKRVENLLKGHTPKSLDVKQTHIFNSSMEENLYQAYITTQAHYQAAMAEKNYTQALQAMAQLMPALPEFLDKVRVMDDDIDKQNQRLGLLFSVYEMMNGFAKLSNYTIHLADLEQA